MVVSRRLEETRLGKEFKRGVARKDVLEEKESLLGRDLVGERDRLGQGDVQPDPVRELGMEEARVVLEERPFQVLGRHRDER